MTNEFTPLKLTDKDIKNPGDYLQVPMNNRVLIVCKYRVGVDDNVREAERQLGLNLENTVRENNGRNYIGYINWFNALKLNLLTGYKTPSLAQHAEFRKLIRLGSEKRIVVYDATVTPVEREELEQIHDEVSGMRDPWRGEFLDADFKFENEVLYLNSNHEFVANELILIPSVLEPLEDCTLEDCIMVNSYIDLDSFNRQGMPTKRSNVQQYIHGQNIYFWHPLSDNNSVARFWACSVGVNLDCRADHTVSYSSLVVRRAKIFERSEVQSEQTRPLTDRVQAAKSLYDSLQRNPQTFRHNGQTYTRLTDKQLALLNQLGKSEGLTFDYNGHPYLRLTGISPEQAREILVAAQKGEGFEFNGCKYYSVKPTSVNGQNLPEEDNRFAKLELD